jgi:hypothetical protein
MPEQRQAIAAHLVGHEEENIGLGWGCFSERRDESGKAI